MSWFEKLAEAMYEVYDDDFILYVSGTVCMIIVLIILLGIIMKFAPWLFITVFVIGVATVMTVFIKAIVNNMKDDID